MDIYQENILDHYKNPRNFGEIKDADVVVESSNASCGDMVKIYFKIRDGKIIQVKQKCLGCSIATAASSMVSGQLIGLTVEEAKKISPDEILKMLGIEISPSRMKCALLPLDALEKI